MWFWLKRKFWRLTPAADLDIVMFTSSDGHAGVRKIRNLRHHRAQLFFELGRELLLALSLLTQRFGLFHQRGSILAGSFATSNFLRLLIALSLESFSSGDRLTPACIEIAETAEQLLRVHPALPQLFFHVGQVLTNVIEIEHKRTNVQNSSFLRQRPPVPIGARRVNLS